MSKHKHYHGVKNPIQALQHGRREAIGPMYHWKPKKKAPVSAANADRGTVDTSDQTVSASIVTENGGNVK